MRLGELVATFALAQDNAFGQPLESQLRSCLLAMSLCDEQGLDDEVRHTTYWVALLRYVGCTGHAHEVAMVFGDEIAIRAQTLLHDAGDPAEVMRDVVEFATRGREPGERDEMARALHDGARAWAIHNFASGCEVADMLAQRLGVGAPVRDALRFTFERWNRNGYPAGAGGGEIPLPMRIVHLTHDMEAIARHLGAPAAIEAARERSGRTYDPQLAELFATHGADWLMALDKAEPWDSVLDREPEPRRLLDGAAIDEALTVAADFIDLKSPYMNGHSRRCARLCTDAAGLLGLTDGETTHVRRAALVHELGTTAVPNSIWDKPGPLTRAEFDRVERHTLLTEQMLRRSAALAPLSPVAAAHHERADGSGYHKQLPADPGRPAAGLLAAADVYVALTADRADRPAFSAEQAAAELRRLVSLGALEARASEAVLRAAGHPGAAGPRTRNAGRPSGLTEREVEVLRLAARGLTTREIAQRLNISAKTADHHVQHVYTKTGVSTRAAAALWAMQHDLLGPLRPLARAGPATRS